MSLFCQDSTTNRQKSQRLSMCLSSYQAWQRRQTGSNSWWVWWYDYCNMFMIRWRSCILPTITTTCFDHHYLFIQQYTRHYPNSVLLQEISIMVQRYPVSRNEWWYWTRNDVDFVDDLMKLYDMMSIVDDAMFDSHWYDDQLRLFTGNLLFARFISRYAKSTWQR